MRTSRVFVDSNVLASKTLRDWLFLIQREAPGLYGTFSSTDVIAEAIRVQRRRYRSAPGSLTSRFEQTLRGSLTEVLDDFPSAATFIGKDPDDEHVHAAALSCNADTLLTSNDGDFGAAELLPYEVMVPDDFFGLVADSAPHVIHRVALQQSEYWQSRPEGRALDEALRDAGCPRFAQRITAFVSR